MRYIISSLFLCLLIFAAGCSQLSNNVSNNHISSNVVHECLGSVGYTWCDAKSKCLRVWEEPCTVQDLAKNMCDRGQVYICGDYVTDNDSNSGALVFYDINNGIITCPIVPDNSSTAQCLQLMHAQCQKFAC